MTRFPEKYKKKKIYKVIKQMKAKFGPCYLSRTNFGFGL